MIKRLKQLGKDSVIYGFGGIVAKSLGFFLLPVYTRLFSPAEYGTIEMLNVINSFLGILMGLGLDSAQSFYFFEKKKEGRQAQAHVISAILQWRLLWGTGVVVLCMVLSPLLNSALFNGKLNAITFAVAFSGAFFSQIATQAIEVYRLLYQPWKYISVTLGQTVGSAGLAISLVALYDQGIFGFFVASLVAGFAAGGLAWWNLRGYLGGFGSGRDWWPRLLKFGVPLVPAGLAMYVMNTADRWFILHFNGENMLGIYAVGAKFAMLIGFAVLTFRQAWWPVAMDAMQEDDGPLLFRTISRLYLGLGSAGIVLLTAISPWIVRWLTADEFHSAYPIVGVLSWHSVFFGYYLIASAGIWKREKTKWTAYLMGGAALLNLALDFWWVPLWGGLGAAAATSVSFLAWNMATLLVSERLWPVAHPFTILLLQVIVGGASTAGILYAYRTNAPLTVVIAIAIVSMFCLLASAIQMNQFKTIVQHLNRKTRHPIS